MNPDLPMSNTPTNNTFQFSQDASNLRGRVVEILSKTANGCLTELGYYPGMPQKMRELEQMNAQWQQENVKLFQDNRSLARALQAQSERLKLITGPEIQRLNAMRTLELKVQALVDERSNLLKQNEALMANQQHNTEYGRLYTEYTKLSVTYGAAFNEIAQLRNYIQVITNGQYTLSSPMTRPTATTNTRQPARQNSEPMNITQSRMAPPIRRPSADYPSQTHPMSQQGGHPQEKSNIPVPTNLTHPFIHYHRPISAPSAIPTNQPSFNHHPPLSIQTSSFVAPSNHQTPHLPPTPMSAVNPSQVSTSQETHNPTTTPFPINFTTIQSNGNVITSSTTTLQQCTQGQVQPDVVSDSAHSALTKVSSSDETSNESLPEAPGASTLSMVAVATTPSVLSQPPDAVTTSSPRPETSKRGSINMSDTQDIGDQRYKKQRLEDSDLLTERTDGQDPAADVNDTARAEGMDVDQESDDGVVEIGPDGLRLEEDCLSALIDDDDEDDTLQTCMLCKARFEMKYTTDPPQVFVRATKEELIEHCSTEHHDAWETLRRNV
ncbi:hypothetical protein BDZ94DRAFT_496160 [Collybia nuda]|uniref:Uncharacterized protein n=1 Tax=Collybia nuda TaxID=64659 RepID=A0A9P5Y9T3_9AGAR|nr:hypothetical protein BDZ94DRAFT_496160 [Collybia nuda]